MLIDHPPAVLFSSTEQRGSQAQISGNSRKQKLIWLKGWWESGWVGWEGQGLTPPGYWGTAWWWLVLELGQKLEPCCFSAEFQFSLSELYILASLMRNLYIRYVRQIWAPVYCIDTETLWIDIITPVRDKVGSWFTSDDSMNLLFICTHNLKPGPFVNDILKSLTFSQGDHQLVTFGKINNANSGLLGEIPLWGHF